MTLFFVAKNRTRTGSDELPPSSIRTQMMRKLVMHRALLLLLGFIFLFGLIYNSWLKSNNVEYETIRAPRPHYAVVHHDNVQVPRLELTCRRWRADESQNSNVRGGKVRGEKIIEMMITTGQLRVDRGYVLD